jgi:hypothetical protein
VETVRSLRTVIGTAATISEQENRRCWWAGSGFVAGCLLWAALPGFVARVAPTDWHWPERLAARIVREPSLWEAGTRLMRADSPEAWDALSHAAEMQRDNREAIGTCREAAAKTKRPVR